MDFEQRRQKEKDYNHQYYLKNREKRRNKIECPLCGRKVCSEYLYKHKEKSICQKRRNVGEIVKTT